MTQSEINQCCAEIQAKIKLNSRSLLAVPACLLVFEGLALTADEGIKVSEFLIEACKARLKETEGGFSA